jgi:hypothetical protein
MSLSLREKQTRDNLRRPKIFAPKIQRIECAPGMRCPRCNEEIRFLFSLGDVARGYFCSFCLLELFDAIAKATGFRGVR